MQYLNNHTDEFGENISYPDGTNHLSIGLSYEDMLARLDGDDGEMISKFMDTIDISDGGFIVEEYIYDKESGFDALVIKDGEGNYRVCYGGTDSSQFGDKYTDYQVVMDNKDPFFNLVELVTGKNFITKQESQANSLADYCFEKAESEGVKLSFSGYSLGGALCENGVVSLMTKNNFSDVVDGVVLINPLHSDISSDSIGRLKNVNNFKMYVNENDGVHTISKNNEYKDVEKTYFMKNDIKESAHNLGFLSNDDYIKYAFNSDGSIKTTIDSNTN